MFVCFGFSRFGKRANSAFNNNNNGDDNNVVDLQQQQQQPQQQQLQQSGGGEIIENGPYRWLLINRDQPLTRLTEVN